MVAASNRSVEFNVRGLPAWVRARTAYEQARSKYAADQVAHLGVDIQEHFKAKAEAVELAYQQAYQKLTG